METKLSLTIYDIVTFLIPGSALLLLLRYVSDFDLEVSDTTVVIIVLIVGYLIGAILHVVGILLFTPFYAENYPETSIKHRLILFIENQLARLPFLRIHSFSPEIKNSLANEINKKFRVNLTKNRLGLFIFSDTFTASHGFEERDILMAKEGFFRSFTALILVSGLSLLWIWPESWLLISLAGTIFMEMARYGREYYRTLKNQQIYMLTLIKLKAKK